MAKSRKKSKTKKFTKIIIAILIIILGVLLLLASLFLSKAEILDDISVTSKDSFTISKYLFSVMNKANKSTSPMQRETVNIKADEVMSLVRGSLNAESYIQIFAGNSYERKVNIDPTRQQIKYNLNEFEYTQYLTKPFLNLVVKAQVIGNIELNNNYLKVNIDSIKIGKISLTKSALAKVSKIAEEKINQNVKQISQYVTYIKFEDNGNITVIYVPYEIKQIIKGF